LKKNRDDGELCVMRNRGAHLSQILLGLTLLAALFWNLAYGAEIRWVQMVADAGKTRAEIGLDAAAEYKILRLSNPARLVVDFPASRLNPRFAVPPETGVVRAVRSGQPVPGTVRIVFDLAKSVAAREPRIERGGDGLWLAIEWPGEGAAAVAVPPPPAPLAPPVAQPRPNLAAHGTEIRWVQMDTDAGGTRAEIGLDAAAEYKILRLSNPARLVVDFPASRLNPRFAVPPGIGVVRAVRSGQPVPGTVRLVFDLAKSVAVREPRIERGGDDVLLVLEWPGEGASSVAATAAPVPQPVSATAPAAATANDGEDAVNWPLSDSAERIAIPAPSGMVPALPPVGGGRPSSPRLGEPSGAVSPAPVAQPRPADASDPPAGAQRLLDPIAQIAAATQSGAAEQIVQVAAATPVAVSVEASPQADPSDATSLGSVAASAPVASAPPSGPPALRSLVIAIDPGHGGRDPGAIGPSGTYEKHVVLAIARELARQIDKVPGMRAQLIRERDVYVELPQRAHLAREARADLFVSIHADAAQNRNAHGASVYTLSTTGASSQHARWLAESENNADLIGGVTVENNPLSGVLLDLAHSGHMKASQDAATHVLTGLSGVGKAHKRQVEYANFSVLRNADMPAMLVETGFISNAAEEQRLKDPAYQRRLAGAILDGIQAFFRNQPPPGTLFAANLVASGKVHVDAGGGTPP